MNKHDREPWIRPEIENEDQEPMPKVKVGDRTRLGREVVAITSFGIITGPEPKMNFLKIDTTPKREQGEDDE